MASLVGPLIGAGASLLGAKKQSDTANKALSDSPYKHLAPQQQAMYEPLYQAVLGRMQNVPRYSGQRSVGWQAPSVAAPVAPLNPTISAPMTPRWGLMSPAIDMLMRRGVIPSAVGQMGGLAGPAIDALAQRGIVPQADTTSSLKDVMFGLARRPDSSGPAVLGAFTRFRPASRSAIFGALGR